MDENRKNTPYQIALPLVLCIGLAGGVLIGTSFNTRMTSRDVGKDVQKLREVLTYIDTKYVDDVKTDKLVDESIIHLLSKLDPHSLYIPASDRVIANEDLRGNFDGIGVEFNIFQDTIVVITALSGGPSEALGIRSGDRIVRVDDENVAGIGIATRDVMRLLKGPRGTKVKVGIKRSGVKEELEFTITRDKIPQYSIDVAYMVDSEIGYIKLSKFSATTYEEFTKALNKLRDSGMKKLVLDLQGNGGGYMSMAIDLADEFLSTNKKIVYTDGKDKRLNTNATSTTRGSFESGDLIILVNEGSASASEILAGALQDNDRALIVGRRTFGKGLVQNPFDLSDGSELRLTISRYYTPSGRSIQKPYDDGDAYSLDIIERYKKGEFFHADSIKFSDSLRYTTANGRTVYGGGGIMPDYFVPLDTSMNSHYLNALYSQLAIYEYAFAYAQDNKEALEAKGLDHFRSKFIVTDQMINNLVKIGQRNKVKPDYADLKKNRKIFEIHVKAQIARRLWGNDGLFPIINETNEIFLQGIRLFDRVPDLNRSVL
ncbi:MAG: S41 family peptidase [Cyclobacteriaceae bacterium]|jgi:carboxyl-terminal processing protease|nr:S41 family peptidase [Cyclobacteriaceae bacterium]